MFKQQDFLRERTGSIRQLASIRRSILDDGKGRGMRVWDVNNGSGLSFSVYPDRGMDIGEAWFKGIPLAWLSKNGPTAPQFFENGGSQWLRTWGGGLLTGCGLINAGDAVDLGEEEIGLHGRLSHTPAENVNSKTKWSDSGFYILEACGEVRQSKVFGENLLLTRRISTAMGDNSILIEDTVENQGFHPSPFMLLYHINLGWPLIDEGCTIETVEHKITPQNANAAAALDVWDKITPPEAGFSGQVFYHDIPATECGCAVVRLINKKLNLALKLEYRIDELPYFVQWRNLAKCEYAIGFEPANCYPDGQIKNAERGMLQTLAPGETQTAMVKLIIEELD
ncbi:MAG: aldose 1-epimerase family protein [Victivallaceae bacterium]|nr:aldose 1-epimerase family protein [Victivallaceae bacterium]MDD3117093.1 aldose 1-epimerase family protein [Victivallaceae bacterium]MDD3703193.1 aldose 1-epimerase family protein [Victivallaceae bacterium]MDD4317074.1 aldose 1-epimerase family protein [Victivallaceae bacterium]MDD5664219.1 aldose 1-epimerase family protein [Victivallaceae bacterium]